MTPRALALSVLLSLAAAPAFAQPAPAAPIAAPGMLRIDVDARDLDRRIFKVTATVPAKPGLLTTLFRSVAARQPFAQWPHRQARRPADHRQRTATEMAA